MAEAFGLAAGVLQVAGFGAEVGGALFKCAKKFHNASKELEAVAGQVQITALSLRQVHQLLEDPSTKALHTPKLYEDTNTVSEGCHEVFRELHERVKTFEFKSNSGKIKFLSRTRWLLDSEKVMELGKVLRHYNDVLHLMVSVMTIVEGRRAATKDELQALEADLKLLAISNKDLSHSNKALTETLAAIAKTPSSPSAVKTKVVMPPDPPVTVAAIGGAQASSPFIASAAMSQLNPIQTVSPEPSTADPMSDHLRRCMESVQELARSISCAMDAWHGKTKSGSSDVHGSFSYLAKHVSALPKELQCVHCARTVPWSAFDLARPVPNTHGQCKCRTQASRANWAQSGGLDFSCLPEVGDFTLMTSEELDGHFPDGYSGQCFGSESAEEVVRPNPMSLVEDDRRKSPNVANSSFYSITDHAAAPTDVDQNSPFTSRPPNLPRTSYHHLDITESSQLTKFLGISPLSESRHEPTLSINAAKDQTSSPAEWKSMSTSREWAQDQIQEWLKINSFSDQWRDAVYHLNLQGEKFLDLGRSGGQRDIGFAAQKLLPQVARESEYAGLVPDNAQEREELRRLRKLIRDVVQSGNTKTHRSAAEKQTSLVMRQSPTRLAIPDSPSEPRASYDRPTRGGRDTIFHLSLQQRERSSKMRNRPVEDLDVALPVAQSRKEGQSVSKAGGDDVQNGKAASTSTMPATNDSAINVSPPSPVSQTPGPFGLHLPPSPPPRLPINGTQNLPASLHSPSSSSTTRHGIDPARGARAFDPASYSGDTVSPGGFPRAELHSPPKNEPYMQPRVPRSKARPVLPQNPLAYIGHPRGPGVNEYGSQPPQPTASPDPGEPYVGADGCVKVEEVELDHDGGIVMGGDTSSQSELAAKAKEHSRRKPATPKTLGLDKVKQSPLMKAHKRKQADLSHTDVNFGVQDAQESGKDDTKQDIGEKPQKIVLDDFTQAPSGLSHQLDSERADRISSLAGLERVPTAQKPTSFGKLTLSATTPSHPMQGYPDGQGSPLLAREHSTADSAFATGSVDCRTICAGSKTCDNNKVSESQDIDIETSSVGVMPEGGSMVGAGGKGGTQTQSMGLWADDVEQHLLAASGGRVEKSSPAPLSRPRTTDRSLQPFSNNGPDSHMPAITTSSYSELSFTEMLRIPSDLGPTPYSKNSPDLEKLTFEKGGLLTFGELDDVGRQDKIVELGNRGDGAAHAKKRRKIMLWDDDATSSGSSFDSPMADRHGSAKSGGQKSGVQALLERWVNSGTTAVLLSFEE